MARCSRTTTASPQTFEIAAERHDSGGGRATCPVDATVDQTLYVESSDTGDIVGRKEAGPQAA
jgi:hypothetical protein